MAIARSSQTSLPEYISRTISLLDYTLIARTAVENGVPINKIPEMPADDRSMVDSTLYVMGKALHNVFDECIVRASDHCISIRITDMPGYSEVNELNRAYSNGWLNDRRDVRISIDNYSQFLRSAIKPWFEVGNSADRTFLRIYPHEVKYQNSLNSVMLYEVIKFRNTLRELHTQYVELKERIDREQAAAELRERLRREREVRVSEARRMMANKVRLEHEAIEQQFEALNSMVMPSSSTLGTVTHELAMRFTEVPQPVPEPVPEPMVPELPVLEPEQPNTEEEAHVDAIPVTVTVNADMSPNQIFQRLFEEQYRARREQQSANNTGA